MPRAVQTNTSQNNVNEDNADSPDVNTNTAERPTENLATKDSISSDCSADKRNGFEIIRRFEEEEDPYSLRCVVDGKLKLFKKDSRVWLHKSSNKGKRKKPDNRERNDDVPPLKIGKLDLELDNGGENRNEHSNVINSLGSYKLYRSTVSEIHSELSSLGDSDADLTYSEATTPSSTPSPSEDCRTDKESESGHSTDTGGSQSKDRQKDFDEGYLNDEVKRNSNSLENLDICNESANNAKSYPDNRNVSRRIAPAIDIEDESIRENMLDYAVNLGKNGDTNARQEFVYSTRSIGSRKDTRGNQSLRPRTRKSSKTRTSRVNTTGYNLRSRRKSTEQQEKKTLMVDRQETITCKGQVQRDDRQIQTGTEIKKCQKGDHGTNQALSTKQGTNHIVDTKLETTQALSTNQGTNQALSTNHCLQKLAAPKQHQDMEVPRCSQSQQFNSLPLTKVNGSRSNNSLNRDSSEMQAGSSQGYILPGPLPLLYLATLAICTKSHQF